jgi:hypothetical protein
MRIALVAAAAAMASACTPVELRSETATATPEATACNAATLGDLVGKRASDARADVMRTRSGARTLRWIAPDAAITMDFVPERVNVYVDGKGRIERFTCG